VDLLNREPSRSALRTTRKELAHQRVSGPPCTVDQDGRPKAVGLFLWGKTFGNADAAFLVARFTRASMHPGLRWVDVFGVAVLSVTGFTVSLLIAGLAFGVAMEQANPVKVGVLTGFLLAALLAAWILRARNRTDSQLSEAEQLDHAADGTPDVYDRAVRSAGQTIMAVLIL
jgi:Na+/H+ antiporter 1